MTQSGAIQLSRAPDRIVIVCDQCGRRGEYSRDRLLAKYGDIGLPDLKTKIATDAGCQVAIRRHSGSMDQCRARYER